MERETIENHIKNLGQVDFRAIARLVLTSFFNLNPINVDGKNDGGSDERVFNDNQGRRTLAVQRTVQDKRWEQKAIIDAEKALNALNITRYFFLTSRAHSNTSLMQLENTIIEKLGIPATCLGAKELAGIIVDNGLLLEFADAIGLQMNVDINERPDRPEILLHAYMALGSDRVLLREEIYDDTIQVALHASKTGLSKELLIKESVELLGCPEMRKEQLTRRIDSLLSRGVIEKTPAGLLRLSPSVKKALDVSDGIYLSELEDLASAQAEYLEEEFSINWEEADCATAATLLARCFVQRQLTAAEHTSVHLATSGISRRLGNPEQDLRDFLSKRNIPSKDVNRVFSVFVELASNRPLVKKLARAATYVAMEGADILKTARTLGAASWKDVIVTLDASVAIPFLCSSLFTPTRGRYSHGVSECIKILKNVGAKLVIPHNYINEIASHLLEAYKYPEMPEFKDALRYSSNGFVAFYYELIDVGEEVPDTLREFLDQFASLHQNASVKSIMVHVQRLLEDYGVIFEWIDNAMHSNNREIETTFIFKLKELKRDKRPLLLEHDVQVLSHITNRISQHREIRMCLTWDASMIAVGRELGTCGWIVSPDEASDIVQSRLPLSGEKLVSLAVSLAKAQEKPSVLGANIIDRVVAMASENLKDWQFRKRLKEFQEEALQRIDLSNTKYIDTQAVADEFLKAEGIEVPKSDSEGID